MFPQLFRRAGYHVTFLTNQFLPKVGEEVYDFSGGFFLNHPVLSDSLFDTRNRQLYRYDDGLLRAYDKMAREHKYEHQLTIFHLMGQHVDYRGRFPQRTRRKFSPEDYNRQDLTAERQQINADYDNATLYNDSIVDEIIRRFEHDNAIVIYVPDHGEMMFDHEGSGEYGESFGRTMDVTTDSQVRQQFEIPFWIWMSAAYRNTHPDSYQQVREARDKPFMTDNLDMLLLGLAGISCPDYRPDDDLLNPSYNPSQPRMLMGTLLYKRQ
jgi:heptose-I-phosphate ethanolaminephosphotransferase